MFKSLNRKVLVSPGERALSRSDHRTSSPEETRGLVMRTDSVTESAWGPPLGYRDTPQPSRRTWRPFLPKSSVPAPRRTGPRSCGCGGEKGGAGRGDGASGPCSAPSLASCSPAPLQKWLQAVSSTPRLLGSPADAFLMRGSSASAKMAVPLSTPPAWGPSRRSRSPLPPRRARGSPRGVRLSRPCAPTCFYGCSLRK